ncbi:MAG: DUF4956 domain-containing protein [Ruminococcaceae bacterium]|nr:DUF4956 domain-containing protein [Oscillospiraceae bacterium]
MDTLFKGIFDGELVKVIDIGDFLICIGAALLLGTLTAISYTLKNEHTKSFAVTLALLPSVVCVVIMMVNGNIGAGVAVAGAFSLVRFRSAPGSAKEIVVIFMAMGTGLIAGMGYIGYAALFTLIMCISFIISNIFISRKTQNDNRVKRTLKITIPEDLDYTGVFDDIFKEFTKSVELIRVKTANMGSMFRLTYDITLIDASKEKQMIDKIRERNGNLEIAVSRQETQQTEL